MSEDRERAEDEGAPPNDARRRAILKALAAAGPVILTVTPFHARAEYLNGVYFEGSCAHDNRQPPHDKCFPNKDDATAEVVS